MQLLLHAKFVFACIYSIIDQDDIGYCV